MEKVRIKRAKDLHFEVPEGLAEAIDELVTAIENKDMFVGLYLDNVQAQARMVEEKYDEWINYNYIEGGWMEHEDEYDDNEK